MPYVCARCVEDEDLQKVVKDNLSQPYCDYCGREAIQPIACDLDVILERIEYAISQEYGLPEEETMYDSEEGEYVGTTLWIEDVFSQIGFELANQALQEDINRCFGEELYCERGMMGGSLSDRQMLAWDGFSKTIKHHRRFTFWNIPKDEFDHGIYEHHPSEMLRDVMDTIDEFRLFSSIPAGLGFWRVRLHEPSKSLRLPRDLAAPSAEQAKYANRMSPAGIPMFYGAEDLETAIVETIDPSTPDNIDLTYGRFDSVKSLTVLDLCNLPNRSGFFCNRDESERQGVAFLNSFQKDLSKPIKKDGRQHIEYVPTQVFTEYVRFEAKAPNGLSYDGIRYPSSKTRMPCVVLFIEQDDCLPTNDQSTRPQVLQLAMPTVTTRSVPDLRRQSS